MREFTTPQDYALHIVEKRMKTDALIIALYNAPAKETFDHFKYVNSHLTDGFAKPGQLVLISPINSQECTEFEQLFQKYALEVDKKLRELNEQEKELLAKRYELLSNVAKYNGLLLGVANNSWQTHVTQVKGILTDLEKLYVSSYNRHGTLKNPSFLQRRKLIFTRLDAALRRFTQPDLGGNLYAGNLRQNLGLSSKSMIHHWQSKGGNINNIPHFAENYKTVANMAKNLKRVGYVGIALTGIEASANILKACEQGNRQACTKAKYVETGKAVGAIGGGIAGGFAATYGGCNLIFGAPTAGTSAFWCAIVAGGIAGAGGAAAGSKLSGSASEYTYDNVEN